jgi:hypothetical protein
MRDRLLTRLGLGLATPAAVFALVWIWRTKGSLGPPIAWSVLAIAAPLAVTLWAALRIGARRRWVASVAQGRFDGWRVVDGEARAYSGVLALHPRISSPAADARVRVLVRTRTAADPFRETDVVEPVAILGPSRDILRSAP